MTTHLGLQRILLPSAQVSQLTTGSITLPSARTAFIPPTSYESIATVSPTSGTSVEFTSIPSTFTHLQIRGIGRTARASVEDGFYLRFNSTTTGYQDHHIYSTSTSSSFANTGSDTEIETYTLPGNNAISNLYGSVIVDILDYANTNKFKTLKLLCGYSNNSSNGRIEFVAGNWRNTSAITSITIIAGNSSWVSPSTFALYGIKGA
jgi:hypothetical protein